MSILWVLSALFKLKFVFQFHECYQLAIINSDFKSTNVDMRKKSKKSCNSCCLGHFNFLLSLNQSDTWYLDASGNDSSALASIFIFFLRKNYCEFDEWILKNLTRLNPKSSFWTFSRSAEGWWPLPIMNLSILAFFSSMMNWCYDDDVAVWHWLGVKNKFQQSWFCWASLFVPFGCWTTSLCTWNTSCTMEYNFFTTKINVSSGLFGSFGKTKLKLHSRENDGSKINRAKNKSKCTANFYHQFQLFSQCCGRNIF